MLTRREADMKNEWNAYNVHEMICSYCSHSAVCVCVCGRSSTKPSKSRQIELPMRMNKFYVASETFYVRKLLVQIPKKTRLIYTKAGDANARNGTQRSLKSNIPVVYFDIFMDFGVLQYAN